MKGKINSKEILKQKIREVLNQSTDGKLDLSNRGIDELVAEVSLYHQELEHQNEELMRIRDELEISEEHFRTLYNDAPIGYLLCCEDLTIQSANSTFCNLISHKEKDIKKTKLTDYIHPDSQDDLYFHIQNLLKYQKNKEVELNILSGGTPLPVKIISNTFSEEGQKFIRVAAIDLTKEKKLENELQTTQQKFKSYIESSPTPIFISNSEGKYTYVNTSACNLLGYSYDELTNLSVFEVVKETDEYHHSLWNKVSSTGYLSGAEIILKNKNGKHVYALLDSVKISENEIIGFAIDITDRKSNEENYHTIISTSIDGFFIIDMNGKFIETNDAYANMIGYSSFELTSGMGLADIEAKEDPKDIRKHISKIIELGSDRFITKQKGKSGAIMDIEISTTYVPSQNHFVVFARNVTEQILVEDELREKNIRFTLAVESAGIAVWEWDVENNLLTWDDKMHELYEVDEANFEGAYIAWSSALHKDDKDRVNNEINLALEGEKEYDTEFKINVKDGRVKYLRAFAKTLRDDNGKAFRMVGANYDITDRILAQNELADREKRFRAMFNDNLAVMLQIDAGTREIVDANEAAIKYYGYTKDELTSLRVEDLNVLPKDQVTKILQHAVEKGQNHFKEYKHRLKDGTIRDVEVFASKIEFNNKPHLITIIHDVTDRKRAEHELKKSEERYRNFFEHDLTGDYLTTIEGEILDCNNSFVKTLGYNSRAELLNTNSSNLYPENVNRDEFLKLIYDKTTLTDHEIKLRKKDGTIINCLENCIGIFDDEGKLIKLQGYLYDITEEIIAEEKLKKSEQEKTKVLNSTLSGLYIYNFVHRENEYINPAYTAITGWSIEELNSMDKKFFELIHSDDIENVSNHFIQLTESKVDDILMIEYRFKSKDGDWLWLLSYDIAYERDESGNVVKFLGSFLDITERKEAEEEMRFQAKLLEEIGESIIATDTEGKIFFWNHAAEVLYGWTQQEVIGQKILEITPSTHSEKAAINILSEVRSGKIWSGEMRLKKKNGEIFDAFVTDTPFFDINNNLQGIIGVSKDITELKIVEKDLRAKNDFIQTVLDNLPIGISLNHINDGKALYINKKFEEIYGWPKEEMKEIPEFFERIYPDKEYREKMVNRIMSDINTGDPNKMRWEDIEIKTKDNECKRVNAQNIPLFDQNTMVSTVLDVTAEKNAEKVLVESQRLSAIGEMSSAIAHDFNNSLQSILGNLDLSLIQLNEKHPSRRYLETIRIATTDAASRVRLLQRFAGKSKSNDSHTELNVNQMIEDVIQQSRPLWKDSQEKDGVHFEIITDLNEVKKILGNEGEIRSVLYNSIKNSIEAMPKGGNITIKTYHKNENVIILIVDNGVGMDEKTKARVFQPFFSTKGFESGRGLGMSGAYSIIKEHNGKIYIEESSPNKGTSLAIELPVYVGKAKTKSSSKVIKRYKGTANILWVDDDKMIREVAQEMLSVIGHKGKIVASGQQAIEELKKDNYDLLVTDIGMPGMSGWELIDKIKSTLDNELKIAVLTGWGDQIGDEEKKKYQIDHVISKPFKIDQLNSIIGIILANK